MVSNYYTLRLLAGSLNTRLAGTTITALFSQEKDELVIEFDGRAEMLVVCCRPGEYTCFLHPGYARAKANTAELMHECRGDKVLGVHILPADRVIMISLGHGGSIALQFFAAQSNILLLDEQSSIRAAFRHGRTLHGTLFTPRAGMIMHDVQRLEEACRINPSGRLQDVVKNSFPELGSPLGRELLHRAQLDGSRTAGELAPESVRMAVSSVLQQLLREIDMACPRVYCDTEGAPVLFSLIAMHHLLDCTEHPFGDLHEALRFFIFKRRGIAELTRARRAVLSGLDALIERSVRTVNAITSDQRENTRSSLYERFGSLLLGHLQETPRGAVSVCLSDDAGPTIVPLDPQLSPVQNAQRYFEKAKRSRQAAREAVTRLEELRGRRTKAEELRAQLARIKTGRDMRNFMTERKDDLAGLGIGAGGTHPDRFPFRRFIVAGGFEVWAGKNSTNNDLLTMRHARPNDLWFHARGAGGSHVILRVSTGKGEPGRQAKEQAAGIAAYYSKMRNARTVPVAVTERKYVRKPRGAPPGTVIIERERVIFASPALPDRSTMEP